MYRNLLLSSRAVHFWHIAAMREQAAALLAHLRGPRTRFVSIGRTPDMPLALLSLVLTRNVKKSIKAARGALAACGDLPPLGPDDIAVVYLNGAGAGNTRIGQPPAGCARCGLVRDGLLVGR